MSKCIELDVATDDEGMQQRDIIVDLNGKSDYWLLVCRTQLWKVCIANLPF